MYNSPFSSLFGEDETPKIKPAATQPGFLTKPEAPISNLKKAKATPPPPGAVPMLPPSPAATPAIAPPGVPPKAKPVSKKSLMKEMQERLEEVEKEEVYKPDIVKKKIFSATLPQFKARVEITSKDPRVKLVQAKFKETLEAEKLKALVQKLQDLKLKTRSAQIYRDILSHYIQLSPSEQSNIKGWISESSKKINKLSAIRKTQEKTKEMKQAISAIDKEIKYYEKLEQLKKKGADIEGARVLKTYQPTGYKAPPKAIPRFKSKGMGPIVKLGYKGEVSQLKGYETFGQEPPTLPPTKPPAMPPMPPMTKPPAMPPMAKLPAAMPPMAKPAPELAPPLMKPKAKPEEKDIVLTKAKREELAKKKGDYLEVFIEGLPGKKHYESKRRSAWKAMGLKKGKEKALLATAQKQWKVDRVRKELNKQIKEYNKVQAKLKPLINAISSKKDGQTITTVFGILAEAQPQKFVVTPSLLDSLKGSFQRLSQLGQAPEASPEPEPAPEPEDETDILLKQTAAQAEVTLRELETRQHTLDVVKAKVEGTKPPPPPPPPIPVTQIEVHFKQQEPPKPDPKQETIKTLNRLLPVVAGFLILSKLLG
jgi:hypothetical protein